MTLLESKREKLRYRRRDFLRHFLERHPDLAFLYDNNELVRNCLAAWCEGVDSFESGLLQTIYVLAGQGRATG